MPAPRISEAIMATLGAALIAPMTSCCGLDRPSYVSFHVDQWALTPEGYVELLDWWDAQPTSSDDFDELSTDDQCRVACAFSGEFDLLDVGLGYETGIDYHSVDIEWCVLIPPFEGDDGWVSCQGVHKITPGCTTGRRPLRSLTSVGLRARQHQRVLDDLAHEEHISITAFNELAAQLEHHGAPHTLIQRCLEAAQDERRHADQLVELGARRPTFVSEVSAATTRLIDIALHNAVEGCVNETWSALEMRHRSLHAADIRARTCFAQIADDEARHAQLAWDLHEWLCRRLDPESARRVELARIEALESLPVLARVAAESIGPEARAQQGLPDPRQAAALARIYATRLAA